MLVRRPPNDDSFGLPFGMCGSAFGAVVQDHFDTTQKPAFEPG